MRLAVGGIVHETHGFAPDLTDIRNFEIQGLYRGPALLEKMGGTRAAIGGIIDRARELHWNLCPALYTAAMPSGPVLDTTFYGLADELINQLGHWQDAGEIDMISLVLHGAMLTQSLDDAEGYLLQQLRSRLGPDIPIGVVLDMHGNVSPAMVEHATILVAFDTNPHVDPYDRGVELVSLLDRITAENLHPTAALCHPPLLLAPQGTSTAQPPLALVLARAHEMEQRPDVLSVCVMGGFAYADSPYTGMSVIVTTDDKPVLARSLADELGELAWEHRQAAIIPALPPREAVRQAMALRQAVPAGPIILVDSADNIGGGSPGDGTDALRALLEEGAPDAVVVLADAQAVARCFAAGAGAQIDLSLGGHNDTWHGTPVEAHCRVISLSDGTFTCELKDNHFASFFGHEIHMGRTAVVETQGVTAILTERKTPPFDLGQLRSQGVIPEKQQYIAVKSAVAYRAAYLPIAGGIVEMDTSGLGTANLSRFPYQRLPRPIFPLDEM
ncbi:MAG: M81 family metallopeptidase [Chloroflexi bacterium]|nr:M81 family metallopeptidase [Chloroflexota bacterium]